MSDQIISEARRTFEVLPGVGTLEHAVGKLSRAGVEHSRIRAWALATAEEYGISHYVRPGFDRMMADAVRTDQPRTAA
jgi:hypothetical protein